jgi:hypothetical protein
MTPARVRSLALHLLVMTMGIAFYWVAIAPLLRQGH